MTKWRRKGKKKKKKTRVAHPTCSKERNCHLSEIDSVINAVVGAVTEECVDDSVTQRVNHQFRDPYEICNRAWTENSIPMSFHLWSYVRDFPFLKFTLSYLLYSEFPIQSCPRRWICCKGERFDLPRILFRYEFPLSPRREAKSKPSNPSWSFLIFFPWIPIFFFCGSEGRLRGRWLLFRSKKNACQTRNRRQSEGGQCTCSLRVW